MGAQLSRGRAEATPTAQVPGRALKLAGIFAGAAVAFFPVTADLAAHFAREPWSRYALVFPLLFLWCALHEGRPSASRSGLLWIGAGALIQGLALAGGVLRFGRHALPLAILGAVRLLGMARLRTALLLMACVPLPSSVASLASPTGERAWLFLAAPALGPGAHLSYAERSVTGVTGTLALRHADAGLVLASLALGLAWYAGIRLGWGAAATAAALAAGALAAVALQALATVSAVVAVGRGFDASLARAALTAGPPLVATLLCVALTEVRASGQDTA